MTMTMTGRVGGVVPFARFVNGGAVVATRLGFTVSHAERRLERSIIRCAHDWIDGACPHAAARGAAGWERRTGRVGDMYWLCPTHAAEFPKPTVSDERTGR